MTQLGSLVVARYNDGRLTRGRTVDFRPERACFHIQEDGASAPVQVVVDDLKALFFVRTLEGDPAHEERKSFRYRKGIGRKIWVEFLDGEELAGWSVSIAPEKGGFFLFPTDANSNMEKVYIVRKSLRRILQDADAEEASSAHEGGQERSSVRRIASGEWSDLLGIVLPSPRGTPGSPEPSKGRAPARRKGQGSEIPADDR